jgi:hypothetical protein
MQIRTLRFKIAADYNSQLFILAQAGRAKETEAPDRISCCVRYIKVLFKVLDGTSQDP